MKTAIVHKYFTFDLIGLIPNKVIVYKYFIPMYILNTELFKTLPIILN